MKNVIKHLSILVFVFSTFFVSIFSCTGSGRDLKVQWTNSIDRTWIGTEFWANRLQDWKVASGRMECTNDSFPLRTAHLLTRRVSKDPGKLNISVDIGIVSTADSSIAKMGAGILVGAGRDADYRSASLAQQRAVPGMGMMAGIDKDGHLFIINLNNGPESQPDLSDKTIDPTGARLVLYIQPEDSANYMLTLEGVSLKSKENKVSLNVAGISKDQISGNVALISNGVHSWFNDLNVSGDKLVKNESGAIGPILGSQYTLSNSIIKLTAQFFPIGENDPINAVLEIKKDNNWQVIAETEIIVPGYTAPFRIENWTGEEDIPYRVKYIYNPKGDGEETAYWNGTFRKDPVDKENIVIAGFTGNHNISFPFFNPENWSWDKDHVYFPHSDLTSDLQIQNPDVLFFSGDQVYEVYSPTFLDNKNVYLDYLYKWYIWMWAFRDLTKDRPSISIPDDHDVYQGNLWGAGGRKTDNEDKGGYEQPAEWVNMVERTQTSHLPDPYDPNPLEQGITSYYTSINYGRIGIAVLEDRKFKSGCRGLFPELNVAGRPDHIIDPKYDRKRVDMPGLKLLGDKQLEFIDNWAADWNLQDMKIALSQTVFANMATHHGGEMRFLLADLDSNGWPQTGRNKALKALRKGFAFMLCGDQHLSTIVHHGVDEWNDAGYSMCVPSIANFYNRKWMPKTAGKNREDWMPEHLGQHVDGFGNKVTVYATTNPGPDAGYDRAVPLEPKLLHARMPGYGIIIMNKKERTITIECWPRNADVTKDLEGQQYTGWPKTISQMDNYGRQAFAYLPTLNFGSIQDPVVQVIKQRTDEIVYTLRVAGNSFKPKVFEKGAYRIRVSMPETGQLKEYLVNLKDQKKSNQSISVKF